MNVKKCPECGNPSYDGAPMCGNCGYRFPKTKIVPSKREDIFQQTPKAKKNSNEQSTLEIIKEKKLLIGIIVLITLIVICGIFLTGSSNNTNSPAMLSSDLAEYAAGDFSFKYPSGWEEMNLTDSEHEDAKFFKSNNTIVEYYSVASDSSLKEINQNRISYAQETGNYVDLLESITLDGVDSSNVILESESGDYTRFVTMINNGELYVFKITVDSYDSVTSDEINNMLNSADIA